MKVGRAINKNSLSRSPLPIRNYFSALRGISVAVVGDIMCDRYVRGDVERISPEAPVQVVRVEREEVRPGGAANVAMNLLPFGVACELFGVTGKEEIGKILVKNLKSQGVRTTGVLASHSRPTTVKSRVIAQNQQMMRLDEESQAPLTKKEELSLWRKLRSALPKTRCVIVSDYKKGVLTKTLLRRVIALARTKKIPVIVDPKGRSFSDYRGATALTPNRKEAEEATGIHCATIDGVKKSAEAIKRTTGARCVLITLGSKGMFFYESPKHYELIPSMAREVYDVAGAGDTVSSLFGAMIAVGAPPFQSAQIANIGAGIVVGKFGASSASPEEILHALAVEHFDFGEKIVSFKNAGQLADSLRSQNKRIIFTNGCFDIIHPGHIHYLAKARAMGDVLMVGLNSDASVRRLKGVGRPLFDENARAQILASLECVDYVVVFGEDTPLKLIRFVKPDVLVKGGDYRISNIVGAKEVKSSGGRVAVVPLKKGFSTSALIRRIGEKAK